MISKPYAAFWERLLAWALDCAIFLLINLILISSIAEAMDIAQAGQRLLIFLLFILSPIGLLYNILMPYYFGGTLGKLLTGLRIVNPENKYLNFKRAAFRQTIGQTFSAILFGLGYLTIFKNPKRQAWHDQVISSYVIRQSALWPLGIVLLLLLWAGAGYQGFNIVQTAMNNQPLRNQIMDIYYQSKDLQLKDNVATESGSILEGVEVLWDTILDAD